MNKRGAMLASFLVTVCEFIRLFSYSRGATPSYESNIFVLSNYKIGRRKLRYVTSGDAHWLLSCSRLFVNKNIILYHAIYELYIYMLFWIHE